MPKLLSGSALRKGGSNTFIQLSGTMPQLPATDSTTTGFTLVTTDKLETSYKSSLGNLEMYQGQIWSNLPDGKIKLSGTGTGFVYVTNDTASTSTTSGALVVEGGIGVGGTIYTQEDIHVNGLQIGRGFSGANNISIIGPLDYQDPDYTEGQENVVIGQNALGGIETAYKSIAIGHDALGSGDYITRTISIGDSSLQNIGTIPAELIKNIANITRYTPTNISNITSGNPAVVTSPSHGLSTGDRITISNVTGLSTSTVVGSTVYNFSLVNDKSFFVSVSNANTFSLYHDIGLTKTVNATTTKWSPYSTGGIVERPMILTVNDHGYSTGTAIVIDGVQGMVELNQNIYWVYTLTGNTFQLYEDNILGQAVTGQGFTPWTTGGEVRKYLLKDNNIAIGANAGNSLYDGEQNFFLGDNIAPNLTTGSYNFFMGHDVATYMTQGSGNISIMGDNLVDGLNNQVNIGSVFYYNGDGYLQLNADTGVGLGTISTSTETGALVVYGGMGISGDVWIGGNIHGNIQVENLLISNIGGGNTGSVVIQTAPDITGFLEIGTPGSVLLSDGTTPYWGSPGEIVSSTSTNAENIFVNETIPSQTYYLGLVETTADFSPVDADTTLSYDTTDGTLYSNRIEVTSLDHSTSTTTGQALFVSGGVGIGEHLYIDKSAYSQDGNPDENNLLYSPKVTVNPTPPADPRIGDIWINSDTGRVLLRILDGVNRIWLQIR